MNCEIVCVRKGSRILRSPVFSDPQMTPADKLNLPHYLRELLPICGLITLGVMAAVAADEYGLEAKISAWTGLQSSFGWVGFAMVANGVMLFLLSTKVWSESVGG